MLPRETLRRPSLRPAPNSAHSSVHSGLQYLHNHQPLWLSAAGWGLAHGCLGAILLDFNASSAIWLFLLASSSLPFYPRWIIPHSLRTWAPGLTLGITFIGMALPEWALFLMALPMGILFASLSLTGNQPVKTSLINSLAVYGCSTLFISFVVFVLGMSRGDRLTLLTAFMLLGFATLTLFLCAPPLGRFSRSIQTEAQALKLWPLGFCGGIALSCLMVGAWTIQSPWAIALIGNEITPPLP